MPCGSLYTPIIGVLGYVLCPAAQEVLLVHRHRRSDDQHRGKYNGIGGKLRPDEDVASAMRREAREEAGIEIEMMALRGTVNWTGFGPQAEDWLGFIFLITRFEGAPQRENEEGTLVWQPVARLAELPMWEGDRYFLPLVFDRDPRIFHGYMPYDGDKPKGWSYVRI